MKKEQDVDGVHVEKMKKIAESLLENESIVYRKGSYLYLLSGWREGERVGKEVWKGGKELERGEKEMGRGDKEVWQSGGEGWQGGGEG